MDTVPPILLSASPGLLAAHYAQQQFVLIPQFLTAASVQKLLLTTERVPIDTVICGDRTITFGQQNFPEDHLLHRFLVQIDIIRFMMLLTQTSQLRHFMCWTSVYQTGQYINAHRDRSGSIQLVVCLQAPPAACGGHLYLAGEQGEQREEIILQPGDAIVFSAATIPHRTSPIVCTSEEEHPQRVVAVGRYFLV